MQFVSWLSGHSDDTWLRRMSVLSMRSSGAGVNPAVTLNELQDCCNFHQRRVTSRRVVCELVVDERGVVM